jgi:hypothetical protein
MLLKILLTPPVPPREGGGKNLETLLDGKRQENRSGEEGDISKSWGWVGWVRKEEEEGGFSNSRCWKL